MTVTKHLRIVGGVQGVFFRESMRAQAADLGVSGWVRNRREGWLEAVCHGDQQAVEELMKWANRGPPSASVEHVDVAELEDQSAKYSGFEVRPTA